jgi:hypothetical protein
MFSRALLASQCGDVEEASQWLTGDKVLSPEGDTVFELVLGIVV